MPIGGGRPAARAILGAGSIISTSSSRTVAAPGRRPIVDVICVNRQHYQSTQLIDCNGDGSFKVGISITGTTG